MQKHTHLLDNSTLHFYHFQLICLIILPYLGWGGVVYAGVGVGWCMLVWGWGGVGFEAFIYCSVRDRDLFEYCLML